jgi:lipopolysaccharide export system protein LptA
MKRLFPAALLLAAFIAASAAHAEKADSTKPTNVEANHMEYDDVKQVNVFTGNVVLTRGTILMKADKMVVTQDPQGYQYVTLYAPPGGLASFRQKRDGGEDQWIDGQAERIEYDDKAEIMKLYSKARMRRLEGSKPTDEVTGEFISYDTRAEFFTVHNTSNGDSKTGGGRIKAVIQPRKDQ